MSTGFVIFCGGDSWRIARVDGEEVSLQDLDTGADVSEAADIAASALSEMGYDGRDVCLALHSSMVLSAEVDSGRASGQNRRQSMLYRFENRLPVDIEDLSVDFVHLAGGRALAIGTENSRITAVVEALAARDIGVSAVCPADLLSLKGLLEENPDCGQYVIVAEDGEANIFAVDSSRPRRWHRTACEADRILQRLEADRLEQPDGGDGIRVTAIGDAPDEIGDGAEVINKDAPAAQLAAVIGTKVIEQPDRAWVNLRCSAMSPRKTFGRFHAPLSVLVMLLVALPILLAGMFYMRALKYSEQADRLEQDQIAAFRRVYPNRSRPRSVRRFLKSEYLRTAASSGRGGDMPLSADALVSMRRFVAALPKDLAVRVNALQIGRDSIIVRGEVKTYADVDRLRRVLVDAGFEARDRGTEKAGKVVLFDMEGRLAGEGG